MNNRFESVFEGKYVELFFATKDFYPLENSYELTKQSLIEYANEMDNNLANIKFNPKIDCSFFYRLPGVISFCYSFFTIDFSAFENLRTLKTDLSENYLKIKSLSKTLKNFSHYRSVKVEEAQSDLSIFTGFENLEILDLGLPNIYNSFSSWRGSLESLKDSKKLRFICIGHIKNIRGIEYLPLDNLETINLYGTPFDNLLFGDKTFDLDKLTTFSKELPKKEVIDAIRNYQKDFWEKNKNITDSLQSSNIISFFSQPDMNFDLYSENLVCIQK